MKQVRALSRKFIFILPCLLLISFFVMHFFEVDLRPQTLFYSIVEPKGNQGVGIERRELALQLEIVVNELSSALNQNQPPSIKTINALKILVNRLEPTEPFDDVLANESKTTNSSAREVCPEAYVNKTYGYPFYDKGYHRPPCQNVPPLKHLITILLNPSQEIDCSLKLKWVLDGIHNTYSSLRILVMSRFTECYLNTKKYSNVRIISTSPSVSDGKCWNELISRVKTPYVFIGRDLYHFTWFSQFERLIDVISSEENIKIVGGAIRNSTGHWHSGCFQSDLKNYVLKFQEGYFISRHECMFCDQLLGPFLARTDFLVQNPVDPSLSKSVLFEDLFLRLKNEQFLSMSCPDIMYFASDASHQKKLNSKSLWIDLIKKWTINRVVLPSGELFKFSCEESGVSCKYLYTETKSYLMPICCIENYIRALKVLEKLNEKFNVRYELDSGSVIGAVKMQGIIPWDIDGDLIYSAENHTFLLNHKKDFESQGFKLQLGENPKIFSDGSLGGGFFRLYTPHSIIEMYGVAALSTDEAHLLPMELDKIPTKVMMNGVWITTPVNPGLYARNRYKTEYLKHSQNWRHLGKSSSWEDYPVGHFKPCPKKNYHACLDMFFTDGNIQFLYPL